MEYIDDETIMSLLKEAHYSNSTNAQNIFRSNDTNDVFFKIAYQHNAYVKIQSLDDRISKLSYYHLDPHKEYKISFNKDLTPYIHNLNNNKIKSMIYNNYSKLGFYDDNMKIFRSDKNHNYILCETDDDNSIIILKFDHHDKIYCKASCYNFNRYLVMTSVYYQYDTNNLHLIDVRR